MFSVSHFIIFSLKQKALHFILTDLMFSSNAPLKPIKTPIVNTAIEAEIIQSFLLGFHFVGKD